MYNSNNYTNFATPLTKYYNHETKRSSPKVQWSA